MMVHFDYEGVSEDGLKGGQGRGVSEVQSCARSLIAILGIALMACGGMAIATFASWGM